MLVPRSVSRRGFFHPEECAFQKTSLDIAGAVEKIIGSVPYLRRLPYAGRKKIALLGFCMCGGLALYALARSKAFAAGIIYYQILFPDPDDLKEILAPLLCHYGTKDANTTKVEIELFRGALDRHRKKYRIVMYGGAGHAFLNNPQGSGEANRSAAEKSVVMTSKWSINLLSKIIAGRPEMGFTVFNFKSEGTRGQ